MLRFLFTFLFFALHFLCAAQMLHEGLVEARSPSPAKGSWGFKNKKGKWEIKPQFDSVYYHFEFGKAIVGKNDRYGVIDHSGKTVIAFSYKEILPQVRHLYPVRSTEGKWGFVDTDGKSVFPPLYENFRLSYHDRHVLLQRNLRWGIYSIQNKELTPPIYKQIEHLQEKKYRALPFATWSVLASDGKVLATADADTLHLLNSKLVIYTLQGRKGLRNFTQELSLPLYDNIKPAKDSVYFAQKNDYWGVALSNGKFLIEPKFEEVTAFPSYFVAKLKHHEKQIYNWNLKLISHDSFMEIGEFSEDYWSVQNNIGLWGYINSKGEPKTPCIYTHVTPFKNGVAKVTLSGASYYIDKNEQQVLTPAECIYYETGFLKLNVLHQKVWVQGMHEYEELNILSEQYYRVKNKQGYGIIDHKGTMILPCVYSSIVLSSDQRLFIAKQKKNYFLFTTSGSLIGKPHSRFDRMVDASEGLVKIWFKGGWGFCDLEGRILISTQYEETGLFRNGLCAIKLRGKWGYINTDERIILQFYYNEPAEFYGEAGILQEKDEYNLINTKGKLTIEYPLQKVTRTDEGFYIIQNKQGLYGLAGKDGKELFHAKYKEFIACEGGLFLVKDEYNYWGAIDKTGRIVVSLKYNTLIYDAALKMYTGGIEKSWEVIKVN